MATLLISVCDAKCFWVFDRSDLPYPTIAFNFTLIRAKIKPNYFLLPVASVRVAIDGRYLLPVAD
jgi:hypothetical protein